jgi:hypothetical protein
MKVFISHAGQDRDLARALASQLSQAGVDVWSAEEQIQPGENWAKKIGEALDSSDMMVAVVTSKALASDALRHDIQYALTSKHYQQRLLPVMVEPVQLESDAEVPWILKKMNPVYVSSSSDDFSEVVQRVQAVAQRDFDAAQ